VKRQAIVGWLSVWLLVLAALPAWAGPLPQTGTKTYRKPAWVLTLAYPASWSVEEPATDVVSLSSDSSGSADVSGVCLVARSAGYANPDYTPEELFLDLMAKIGATADDFKPAPADARRIAGINADVASFTVGNSSGTPLQGNIYRVVKGRYGYGIVVASSTKTWGRDRSNFDALLDSIQLGATPPSKRPTPTRTPRPPAATPTPEPTRTPRPPAATPTPEPTPEAAGLTSAREAYELAWPDVEEWSPDAILAEADCTGASPAGKCREWEFMFMMSADTDVTELGYRIVVNDGQLDTARSGEDYLFLADQLGTDWMDSTEAVQAFLDDGGRQFLDENPQAAISNLELYSSEAGSPMWTVRATAGNETNAEFARDVDAISGEMLTPGD
jgi:hypothetical protein